jgi:hypothetical protein
MQPKNRKTNEYLNLHTLVVAPKFNQNRKANEYSNLHASSHY